MSPIGLWCPVLHAHLPFVRHPEHEHFLEEDWLHEAVLETHLPLLRMMDNLERDGVRFRLTMTLSPPLLAMLTDPLLMKRCERRIESLLKLASREATKAATLQPEFLEATRFAEQEIAELKDLFTATYRRDLVGAFARHRAAGSLEIITCGATHGFLPLMQGTEGAVRAQIQTATADFRRILGFDPEGIWLPECGYFEGVEKFLLEAGLGYSFLEEHGVTDADPTPSHGVLAPVLSTGGIAFFGRDMESSRQVWSSEVGYPGDPQYREFYKDLAYEVPDEDLLDFINPGEPRRPIGLKRHRITGRTELHLKEPYVRRHALERVAAHADHFVRARTDQSRRARPTMSRPPLMVSPFDAELFGHWWFEGPQFLEAVFRKLHATGDVAAVTPPEYLESYDECEVVTPLMSTWGAEGFAAVWLDESNDWIYAPYDAAVRRMTGLADRYPAATGIEKRALNQAGRELLLAQASDWAFIMKTGTLVEYASRRVMDHLQAFDDLAGAVESGDLDPDRVLRLEEAWPIFPDFDYRVFATVPS